LRRAGEIDDRYFVAGPGMDRRIVGMAFQKERAGFGKNAVMACDEDAVTRYLVVERRHQQRPSRQALRQAVNSSAGSASHAQRRINQQFELKAEQSIQDCRYHI
jgi:hypothetical protein